MAVGLHYKHSDSDVLATALGARRNDDVEAYFSVTRLFLAGPFDRNWLLNGTLRATRANETGLLGFGGIAGASAGIAQILFFVFLALLVLSLIAGLFRRA